jgi:hypothetical protein
MIDNNVRAMPLEPPSASPTDRQSERPQRGSWWSRYSTIVNFWLDVILLILFMIQAWLFAVIHVVFPRGAGSEWKIWGATPLDWAETLFAVYCVFGLAIVVHVMFHWSWICGVISTKLLQRKARKDDGSQTLIGVGVIVVLAHLLIAGILLAKVGLTPPV